MIKKDAMQHDEQQLGRYRLLKQIGRGGMGEVWLAEDPRLQRQVAIKMLPPKEQYSQEDADLFEREAQVVASLNHPHVLPVHDYGEQQFPDGQVINYLVMPYISGGSLSDLIKQRTASSEGFHYREVLALLRQAAEAIDYAHTKGMVHRDIKPANMLLRPEGSLLLADFGIALMVAHSGDSQEAGAMVGTPLYIAPEQAQGRPTAASDLYSLAVIAYQFVTGRPPFQAETSYATIVQHIVQTPPPPRQWNPDLPAECEEVLLRGLAKKPEERYPTAREFVVALTQSLGAEDMLPVAPFPPSPAQDRTRRFMTRRNLIIGAAASVVVLGGAAGGIWVMSRNATSQPMAKRKPLGPAKSVMVLRDLQSSPRSLLWMPSKNILTTTCFDEGAIKLWDIDALRLQNLPEYKSTFTQKMAGAADAAWSKDGRYLAVTDNRLNDEANTMYIHILSADLSRQLAGFEQGIKIPSIFVRGMGWLGSRYLVATWDDNNNINSTNLGMWDITRPQLRPQPQSIKGIAAILDAAISDNVEMHGQTDLSLAIAPNVERQLNSTCGGD
jgi:serine/threonine protein kinase